MRSLLRPRWAAHHHQLAEAVLSRALDLPAVRSARLSLRHRRRRRRGPASSLRTGYNSVKLCVGRPGFIVALCSHFAAVDGRRSESLCCSRWCRRRGDVAIRIARDRRARRACCGAAHRAGGRLLLIWLRDQFCRDLVTPVHSAAVCPLQNPMPSNRAATNTHSTKHTHKCLSLRTSAVRRDTWERWVAAAGFDGDPSGWKLVRGEVHEEAPDIRIVVAGCSMLPQRVARCVGNYPCR